MLRSVTCLQPIAWCCSPSSTSNTAQHCPLPLPLASLPSLPLPLPKGEEKQVASCSVRSDGLPALLAATKHSTRLLQQEAQPPPPSILPSPPSHMRIPPSHVPVPFGSAAALRAPRRSRWWSAPRRSSSPRPGRCRSRPASPRPAAEAKTATKGVGEERRTRTRNAGYLGYINTQTRHVCHASALSPCSLNRSVHFEVCRIESLFEENRFCLRCQPYSSSRVIASLSLGFC